MLRSEKPIPVRQRRGSHDGGGNENVGGIQVRQVRVRSLLYTWRLESTMDQ